MMKRKRNSGELTCEALLLSSSTTPETVLALINALPLPWYLFHPRSEDCTCYAAHHCGPRHLISNTALGTRSASPA